jgi:large conductance mechanosensitive channel
MGDSTDHQPASQKTPDALPPHKKAGVARGFVSFIQDYGVAPLAVGVILANTVNDFVKSFVAGIITPLVSLISPGSSFQDLHFQIGHSDFQIGMVLSSLLSLLIVALLVYIVAKVVLRNESLLQKK